MRIEEQGIVVAVPKPESVGRVVQPRSQQAEITINDLKLSAQEKASKDEIVNVQGDEQLEVAVENANKFMDLSSYHLKFRIDKDSNRLQVSLIDNDTQEVIREVPAKQMLDISARIKQVLETINKMVGVFVDEIG